MHQLFNDNIFGLSSNRSFINYFAVICDFYSDSVTSGKANGVSYNGDLEFLFLRPFVWQCDWWILIKCWWSKQWRSTLNNHSRAYVNISTDNRNIFYRSVISAFALFTEFPNVPPMRSEPRYKRWIICHWYLFLVVLIYFSAFRINKYSYSTH